MVLAWGARSSSEAPVYPVAKRYCPSVSDWTLLATWMASELLTFLTEVVRVMITSVPVPTVPVPIECVLLLW